MPNFWKQSVSRQLAQFSAIPIVQDAQQNPDLCKMTRQKFPKNWKKKPCENAQNTTKNLVQNTKENINCL